LKQDAFRGLAHDQDRIKKKATPPSTTLKIAGQDSTLVL